MCYTILQIGPVIHLNCYSYFFHVLDALYLIVGGIFSHICFHSSILFLWLSGYFITLDFDPISKYFGSLGSNLVQLLFIGVGLWWVAKSVHMLIRLSLTLLSSSDLTVENGKIFALNIINSSSPWQTPSEVLKKVKPSAMEASLTSNFQGGRDMRSKQLRGP